MQRVGPRRPTGSCYEPAGALSSRLTLNLFSYKYLERLRDYRNFTSKDFGVSFDFIRPKKKYRTDLNFCFCLLVCLFI